jgi:DNA-binding PadR family transcriptional regulator
MRRTQSSTDVLCALFAADDQELDGWAIMKMTQRSGPSVYKVLDWLATAQWVSRRWAQQAADSSESRRRFYRLTPRGAACAKRILVEQGLSTAGQPQVVPEGPRR